MIRYLHHSAIDRERWDRCIEQSPNGNIYAQCGYLNTVCGDQWEALISGNYEAVFPLPWNRKWGIYYLYQPYFTQQLGLFSRTKSAPPLNDFLNRLPSTYQFIELNLNEHNGNPDHPDFESIKRINYKLSLQQNYETIYDHYSENHQRNIKKARNTELTTTHDLSPTDLIGMFRQTVGKDLPKIKKHHYQILQQIMEHSLQQETGFLWGAQTQENELCAAAFWLESQGDIILLMNASSATGRQTGAMHFLIDQFIQDTADSYNWLDFEGSNISSLARFYRSFGAEQHFYWRIRQNRLPWYIRWLK